MKRGQRIAIAVITLSIILAGVLALTLRPAGIDEPVYNGNKLSEWIEIYENSDDGGFQAVQAIQHIGTNALPTLVYWINYDPPDWRLALANRFGMHGQVGLEHLAMGIRGQKALLAVGGFRALGTNAYPAVPDLLRLLGPKSPFVSRNAFLALMSLPDNRYFIGQQASTNREATVRASAALYSNTISIMDPKAIPTPPIH